MTNWQCDHACSMSSGIDLDVTPDTTPEDDPEPYSYCGPAKSMPRPRFNPYQDVLLWRLCALCVVAKHPYRDIKATIIDYTSKSQTEGAIQQLESNDQQQ